MAKDHIPSWAGGTVSGESLSGIDRVRQIVRDAEMVGNPSPGFLTVAQARDVLAALDDLSWMTDEAIDDALNQAASAGDAAYYKDFDRNDRDQAIRSKLRTVLRTRLRWTDK